MPRASSQKPFWVNRIAPKAQRQGHTYDISQMQNRAGAGVVCTVSESVYSLIPSQYYLCYHYTHTRAHTHTHARTHTYTHTLTWTHTLTRTHTLTCTHMHTHTTHTLTHMHTHTHTHTHTCTHTHAHTHTQMHAHSHACMHTHTLTCMHTHTHKASRVEAITLLLNNKTPHCSDGCHYWCPLSRGRDVTGLDMITPSKSCTTIDLCKETDHLYARNHTRKPSKGASQLLKGPLTHVHLARYSWLI